MTRIMRSCRSILARLVDRKFREHEVVWVYEKNHFPMPQTAFFTLGEVEIVYHPIVPDTAAALIEKDRFCHVISDRVGFRSDISRMLPFLPTELA